MKVKYEKPELNFVVFELNEAVASCQYQVFTNHNDVGNCDPTPFGAGLVGEYTFTTDKDSCADSPIDGFCYFTSQESGGMVLFGS